MWLPELLQKFLMRRSRQRTLQAATPILTQLHAQREPLRSESDDELRERARSLRLRAAAGSLDELLPECFAVAAEAAHRTLGLEPFEVQWMAGIVLHRGLIAEMQTGEGKTLAAVFPAVLNALTGEGVHVLTVNDYLARRDAAWMGPVYRLLGITVEAVQQGMSSEERQHAYAADVTYGTANEIGFDYLRDHLCYDPRNLVQRAFHYAIVDEADSILIDEARIPLVIAGGSHTAESTAYRMAAVARGLTPGWDYSKDEYARNVNLTERGAARVEAMLASGNLYESENLPVLAALNHAIHAKELLRRDVDYLVKNGAIEVVDEFKGRIAENRRWPDGLQAAIEAKEGVGLKREGRVLGSITLQNLIELYPKVAGMTATAATQAEEFKQVYDLEIVSIPTNRPQVRGDEPDVFFTHRAAKETALSEEIRRVHQTGRPILVGTASVAESERLGGQLTAHGIPNRILNARNDEQEAAIIAQAGALGAVTISTNMAGRGTDIILGGNPPRDRDKVAELGGLYVIGTNKHESRRIDNQLRGRAGRQGDPGSSRFFISLDDDLVQRFGIMELLPEPYRRYRADGAVNDPALEREVNRVQRIVESQNLEIRRMLWKYEAILEQQRRIIHERRRAMLLGRPRAGEAGETASPNHVENRIRLAKLDELWSDYLVQIAELREGIHWVSVAGHDPVNEFRKRAIELFDDLLIRLETEEAPAAGTVDLDTSSTWTYLINDQPMGDLTERLRRGIRSKVLAQRRV